MYNPLINKKPYGATAVGKENYIEFPLDVCFGAKRVRFILRNDSETFTYEMMRKTEDVWCVSFKVEKSGIYHYRFEADAALGICYFGQGGDGVAVCGEWLPEWQLTVSEIDYKTPDWAKGGIIYHIFADRFCKVGDNTFDKDGFLHTDWYELPTVANQGEPYYANDYFGGNIKGIISKLDYLKSLGVTILYLSPIFESFSNHRYDTGDYFKIDPLFGTEKEFKQLIDAAKDLGMYVMLDGVFNHTGSDSVYFNKKGRYDSVGAYQSIDSPYHDWYYFYKFPDEYHCWWGSTVVPTVNKSNEDYRKMIFGKDGVLKKWMNLGVKGWRLDVVDELPIDFVYLLADCVKSTDKDCLLIGEVWEDASTKVAYSEWRPYFMGRQLDGVMNYPFKEAILAYAINGNVYELKGRLSSIMQNYPKESLDVLLNMLGSHDTVRVLNTLAEYPIDGLDKKGRAAVKLTGECLERAKRRLKIALALLYFLPGNPCIYYGDEAGLTGYEDPINRRTYPWGFEDKELIEFYRKLGNVRAMLPDETLGETYFDDDLELVHFVRVNGGKRLDVYVNNSPNTVKRSLDGRFVDMWTDKVVRDEVIVEPYGFAVLKSAKK